MCLARFRFRFFFFGHAPALILCLCPVLHHTPLQEKRDEIIAKANKIADGHENAAFVPKAQSLSPPNRHSY